MKIKIPTRKETIIIIAVLIIKILISTVWDYNYNYDHDRNLQVIRELRNYGALTYYGNAYVINPPLYYMTLSTVGQNHATLQYAELILYFLAGLTVYTIAKRITNQKAGLIAYALFMITPTSLLTEGLDFIAISLLMTGLLIISYDDFIQKPNWKNTTKLGITTGLCMLTKDSFAILIITIITHYLIFVRKHIKKGLVAGLIGIAVYSPWLIYLYANKMPFMWQTHEGEITGNLKWTNTQIKPIYEGFLLLIQNWPIMTIISITAIILIKSKNQTLRIASIILLIGPLITRIALSYFALDHAIFIMISLPIITSTMINTLKNQKIKYAIIALLAIEIIIGNINMITREGSFNPYECELFSYAEKLNTKQTILVYQNTYVLFQELSQAKFEHVPDKELILAYSIIHNSETIISSKELPLPINKTIKCNFLGQGEQEYKIYNIITPRYLKDYIIKVTDEKGTPISDAQVITNDALSFKTNNAGEARIRTNNEITGLMIVRNGFETKKIIPITREVKLKRSPFTITYKQTRY